MPRPSDPRSKALLAVVPASADRAQLPALDFDSIYDSQVDFVWRTLGLFGVPREQREDAAQDVFGVIARQLPSFQGHSSLRTWVFAIVQKVAANQRRTQRRKVAPLQPLNELPSSPEPGPDVQAEALEAARRIEQFCAQLDAGWRSVFVLSLLENVPAPEVADALGIPLNTVYSRVRTLRLDLKRWLAGDEVEHG